MNESGKAFKVFKNNSGTFYYASFLFQKDLRSEIAILYRFLRTADNFVDQQPQDGDGLLRFKEETFRGLRENVAVKDACIQDFIGLCQKYNFEIEWVESFFASMEMDLKKGGFNRVKLDRYIYGSAEVVGLMIGQILKLPKNSDYFAKILGRSFQKINFLRDVREDLLLGRLYFPSEDLQKYKISALGKNMNSFKFIKYQVDIWFKENNEALPGLRLIPRRPRMAIKTANDLYRIVAKKIYKNPEVVFKESQRPGFLTVLFVALKNLIEVGIVNK